MEVPDILIHTHVISCTTENCEFERLKKQVTELQAANTEEVNKRRKAERLNREEESFIRVLKIMLNNVSEKLNINKIQAEHKKWELKNFGEQKWFIGMTGITEEVGELAHALLKRHQNIRTNEPHIENAKDALGDIFVYMMALCNCEGWDLETIISDTWNKVVKNRDWKADNIGGGVTPSFPDNPTDKIRYQCNKCLSIRFESKNPTAIPTCCDQQMILTP